MNTTVKKTMIFVLTSSLLIMILFFLLSENLYRSRYSSARSNARSVAYLLIDYLMSDTTLSVANIETLQGYCEKDYLYVNSINRNRTYIEVQNDGTDMGNALYWSAILQDNMICVRCCPYDIINDEDMIAYSFGDGRKISTLLNNKMIGYYELDLNVMESK